MALALINISALFNEIHLLSAQLKKPSASHQQNQKLLLATKSLLQTLHEGGPQTVPSIALARNSSRQNIQIIANRLQALGCIEFIPNPNHKKSDLLRLTPKGESLLASSMQHETDLLNSLASQLPEHDLHASLELLRELRYLLDPAHRPASSAASSSQGSAGGQSRRAAKNSREMRPDRQRPTPQITPEDESLPVNLL